MSTTTPDLDARRTLGAGALTTRFDDALQFAFERHRFHSRKGSRVPYLSHLMSVCALVLEHGGSEDQAIAALLHDAVEDAATGQGPDVLEAIGDQFGESVRGMVAACSDSLNDEGGKQPWRERKLAYVHGLGQPGKKSDEALLVTAADKIPQRPVHRPGPAELRPGLLEHLQRLRARPALVLHRGRAGHREAARERADRRDPAPGGGRAHRGGRCRPGDDSRRALRWRVSAARRRGPGRVSRKPRAAVTTPGRYGTNGRRSTSRRVDTGR
jgi:hypothetical protein